jgi:hypothetical protein
MVASFTLMLSLLVTNWKSDVFLNDTDPLDRDLLHYCHTVDPHCFDADPDPDPAQNLDVDLDPGGGGGRSAKMCIPPWQHPRYAPAS